MTNIKRDINTDGAIDLRKVASTLWLGKKLIVVITGAFVIISIAYSLFLPNIYKAEAIVAPHDESSNSNITKMIGQLGGLASLAGIDLGSGGNADKTKIALQLLESHNFLREYIETQDIIPEIMAVEKWSPSENLIFDDEIYDPNEKKWVRDVKPPKNLKPSSWEYVTEFKESNLIIRQESETGFIRIAVQHESPIFAKNTVDSLIYTINETMRERDIKDAESSLKYLEEQLESTSLSTIQQGLYDLIESQLQTLMLANIRSEYMFQVLDPAIIPEEKHKPSRFLIVILGGILGSFLSMAYVLIRYYPRNS
ncbi:LPS O-antigen length regulator [Pseudidiomarina gelatinasegens]|uniref:LPS O-antigen length regulator n=1 Tax=Pseudidiomarina gelatinasegens TaxID=2487740 RepID=A0A443Z7U0_9GAMM|nr:Wzz/FepE/Etk N-terminal domain-containing protein [Pseudidiomarina gelatinasegens]RWU12955.1 LPS O-antigen length regulator [Pseudidiomarina gelatinasegens]